MIIDAHSHVHDPVEPHLAALDDAGVDRAVLFSTRPHPERAVEGEAARIEPVLAAAHDHGGLPVVVHGFAPPPWKICARCPVSPGGTRRFRW